MWVEMEDMKQAIVSLQGQMKVHQENVYKCIHKEASICRQTRYLNFLVAKISFFFCEQLEVYWVYHLH